MQLHTAVSSSLLVVVIALCGACPTTPAGEDAGPRDAGGDDSVEGLSLLPDLAGLWSGPATQTVLGDFPRMNVDLRPVDDRTLFGRVDLDAENSLRFLFTVEDHGDGPVLVYRNGGLFQGMTRDSRTRLENAAADAGSWRFCSVPRGCGYIDAVFELDGDDLLLDATVNGETHVVWSARRLEARAVSLPFPADDSAGAPDQPFPDMPRADVTATFSEAEAGAQVLLSLSTTECPLNPAVECPSSRWFLATLAGGETSTTMPLEQLHPGRYYVNAVLDRDGDGVPSSGDALSVPNRSFDVVDTGTSTLTVAVTVGL